MSLTPITTDFSSLQGQCIVLTGILRRNLRRFGLNINSLKGGPRGIGAAIVEASAANGAH